MSDHRHAAGVRCPRRESGYTSRREFLSRVGGGFGSLALADLLARQGLLAAESGGPQGPLAPRAGHFAARAKAVIWLFMEGGPSGFDLFDPKPQLAKRAGQKVDGIQTHFGNPGPLLASPFKFQQYGQSGTWVCEKYRALANHVDDIALVKSVFAESPNHSPAMYQMNTGITRPGFPSAGAWVTYGLGSENQNLPGFVVLPSGVGKGGAANWSAGFLPGSYQGTLLRTSGDPILNLSRPAGLDDRQQRAMLDLAAQLNAEHLARHAGEGDLLARIESFELAYRMQMEAPAATRLSEESADTHKLYGLDRAGGTAQFGSKCLLARRLVERGVRFVQVYSNDEWDAHGDIAANHSDRCAETDVPIAGLLTDLKQRGLLDSTLVVWGGEFGRMPVSEGGKGRDHNPHGFLMWMAGGGIRGGTSYGETDEIGYQAAVDKVSVPDIHATILHQLGLDHQRLTYKHNGRQYRLTDVSGNVLEKILA
jgi:hypothetical protein